MYYRYILNNFEAINLLLLPTRNIKNGSFRMNRESMNTNAGAEENKAVTSVGDVLMRALEYI